jgi:hypothetical protein
MLVRPYLNCGIVLQGDTSNWCKITTLKLISEIIQRISGLTPAVMTHVANTFKGRTAPRSGSRGDSRGGRGGSCLSPVCSPVPISCFIIFNKGQRHLCQSTFPMLKKGSTSQGINPWKKHALDLLVMEKNAADAAKMKAFPEASGSIPSSTVAVSPRKRLQDSLVHTEKQIPPGKQPQKQGSSKASKCTTQPFKSSKPNVESGGALKILAPLTPQISRVPRTTTIQTTTASTLSAPVVGIGHRKPVFLHLLDLGLQLDQLCCQKDADQVTCSCLQYPY